MQASLYLFLFLYVQWTGMLQRVRVVWPGFGCVVGVRCRYNDGGSDASFIRLAFWALISSAIRRSECYGLLYALLRYLDLCNGDFSNEMQM